MTRIEKKDIILGTIIVLLYAIPILLCFVFNGVEPAEKQTYDTSTLESWSGGAPNGTIRMVGAWQTSDSLLEDETGNLWEVDLPIEEDDFLLLWIADNKTPDNVKDDLIIKVWREVH